MFGEKNVGALDVTVNDALRMEMGKSERCVFGNLHLNFPAVEAFPLYRICQITSFDVLHDNHVMMNMVELDDMSVSEIFDDLNFLFRALVRRIEEPFDHNIIEAALGLEDFCLSTTTNLFFQLNDVCLDEASTETNCCLLLKAVFEQCHLRWSIV